MDWIVLPDHIYDVNSKMCVHEVRCPKCHCSETFIKSPPISCYICGEARTMPEVK